MSESNQPEARARVLAVLQAAGPKGITTWDLIHEAKHSRAAGRVWELAEHYEIEHVREKGNVHRWIYRGPKPQPSLLALMQEAS